MRIFPQKQCKHANETRKRSKNVEPKINMQSLYMTSLCIWHCRLKFDLLIVVFNIYYLCSSREQCQLKKHKTFGNFKCKLIFFESILFSNTNDPNKIRKKIQWQTSANRLFIFLSRKFQNLFGPIKWKFYI